MLMNGDACAAAILNAFEMWSKGKSDFIYKSVPQMYADFMGVFGHNKIGAAFKELRQRGFLLARKNPVKPQDQTLQYLFQPLVIQRAMFLRQFLVLNVHALKTTLQTLFLKSQALILKRESESISESKTEGISELDSKMISRERDFHPEGIDQTKFFQDDPPDSVPPYLREQMPSAEIRQQLAAHSQQLGLKTYAEVINRCANARSWEYVLKALANEHAPTPLSAPPPSPAEAPTEPDWMPEITKPETPAADEPVKSDDPNVATWALALSQLGIQLDPQAAMWLRGVTYNHADGVTWVMDCPANAQATLQHRLYREIRRVVRDVRGEVTELRFETAGAVTL